MCPLLRYNFQRNSSPGSAFNVHYGQVSILSVSYLEELLKVFSMEYSGSKQKLSASQHVHYWAVLL